MSFVVNEAQALQEQIRNWRRELHTFPEVGLKTPLTEEFLCRQLDAMGAEYRRGIGGHGVVAVVRGARPGGCLMFRCDCDGLPIREESGESFSSKNENMHACGHDAHSAIGLGVVKLLLAHQKDLSGSVKILFQPAEEIGAGAQAMITDGCMEDPVPDAAFALHVSMGPDKNKKAGVFHFIKGAALASMDRFEIELTGKGSHGAVPEMSRDPVVAAERIITGLQTIVSRNACPMCPSVVSVCQFEAGETSNVIPETARLVGTARTLWPQTRDLIERRLDEIARLTAESMGVKADVKYVRGAPPLINDEQLISAAQKTAADLFGAEEALFVNEPMMAGDDFAFYTEHIPGAMAFFIVPPADGHVYNMHNCHFRIDDSWLWRGTALFAALALGRSSKENE
ncbi:MAG: M20 metallopeptidase family protein [Pyramidobacter sp.]|jgi:amidohydrolase